VFENVTYLQLSYCRAQQLEQRILREKIQQEIDPGNPYWELIKMIRYIPQLAFLTMTNIRHFWVASNSREPMQTIKTM
jgi:hypothetical protein